MDIKEFKYAWRYTSENYALFSPKQLSEMNVVNENKAVEIWNSICDNEILQKSSYVQMMIDHKLTVFIGDIVNGFVLTNVSKMLSNEFIRKKYFRQSNIVI